MKKWIIIINAIIYLSSFLSFLICIISNKGMHAELSLLPLAFLLTYAFIIRIQPKNKNIIISYAIIVSLSWLRLVIIPMFGVIQQTYSFDESNLMTKSALLMVYEQICISIVYFLYSQNPRHKQVNSLNEIKLKGSKHIYVLFILVAVFVYVLWGRSLDLFDFVIKPVTGAERSGDITDFTMLVIRQIISGGITFVFLYIIEILRVRYRKTPKKKYSNIAIFCALLLVGIIVGERRSNQVYIAFAAIWTLVRIFPLERKVIIRYISLITFFVLLFMTVYKQLNAFLYTTYIEAIEKSSGGLGSMISANVLDSYFYGINTVMNNIDFADNNLVDTRIFFFDFLRNIFGLNYLVDRDALSTVELYNYTIYYGEKRAGFLYSSIAYGYTYFGTLVAPIMSVFNVSIIFWLEKTLKKCRSIEMTYIIAYVFMRFAFGLYASIGPLLNFSSRYLFVYGGIFLLAYLMNPHKNHRVNQ
jgi:hypothetical protein